jgi:uncharacterized membrane protein YfbV (UPF0208 family)
MINERRSGEVGSVAEVPGEAVDESRKSLNQVLVDEFRAIRGVDLLADPDVAATEKPMAEEKPPRGKRISRRVSYGLPQVVEQSDTKRDRVLHLKALYARIHAERPLSALCLSGGGIRSATFNLGILQALAGRGVLKEIDYLSSVSGGGYVAGWLTAWFQRGETASAVYEQLSRRRDGTIVAPGNPLAPEANPIDNLREYSNYLTPRLGLFSADSWTLGALYLRNLLLNWLVILPALALVLALPQLAFLTIQTRIVERNEDLSRPAVWVALVALTVASVLLHRLRAKAETPSTKVDSWVLRHAVVPIWIATTFLTVGIYWIGEVSTTELWSFIALWCVGVPLAGLIVAHLITPDSKVTWRAEIAGIIGSGVVGGLLLFFALDTVLPHLREAGGLYVVLALPFLFALYLLTRVFHVAIATAVRERWISDGNARGAGTDHDREWWARLSAWILIGIVGWVGLSTISLFGGSILGLIGSKVVSGVAAAGGVAGVATTLLAHSAKSASGRAGSGSSTPMKLGILLGSSVFIVSLALLLGTSSIGLARLITGETTLFGADHLAHHVEGAPTALTGFFWAMVILAAFTLVMNLLVNVNRFSLHALYRNRLVRAYLGASNTKRDPDPFTGFDEKDNLALCDLYPRTPMAADEKFPFLVVNTALNLVRGGKKLAWQERKAESFSMTPLYCGNFYEGYRASERYADRMTLGTAMTISGAAASPNMGYHSSATVTFLLGLFNARLGAWLGNTNANGNGTFDTPGPQVGAATLFADLFGLTNAENSYVNLSDGGHFENLGIYEMVLRRVNTIIVCDAGSDAQFGFQDLGNAIRKIRIDFGIPIVFDKAINIKAKSETGHGLYCAYGTIDYGCVDGGTARRGRICYIKPTVLGAQQIPYDVTSYARNSPTFPHESTADQWFDESQFESYRALGVHAVESISGTALEGETEPVPYQLLTLDQFFARVVQHTA